MVAKRLHCFLFAVLVLSGCSLQARKDQADVRALFKQRQYDQALKRLENSEIKKEEKNRLLYLLQKGKLLRAQGRNLLAANTFVEAGELMDKLYTKSVSEAFLSGVSNNNAQTYVGSPYERSLLFYYQALSFYEIYRSGHILEEAKTKEATKKATKKEKKKKQYVKRELDPQERRRYLFRARASIVAWDAFYKELQRSSREETKFTRDLFAKILGAKIHEIVGERRDEQIALQLYQDALAILRRLGPAFKSYNSSYESYAKGLFQEEQSGPPDNEQKLSSHYQRLEDFLAKKILFLAKKRQAWKYRKLKARLAPSKEVLEESKKRSNVTFLLERGAVAPLKGEDFSYNLRSALENVEDPAAKAFIRGIGLPVLTYFAMGPLALASVSTGGNAKLYVRHGIGEAMTAEAGIEFEMPVIKEPQPAQRTKILVYKAADKIETENAGPKANPKRELVASKEMALAGPVSDLAYQMNLERVSNAYAARGARIAVKHALAIIAAYKTYESVKKTSGEMFAKPAAFAQYLVSAKAIKESERADTRQWSVLPSEVFIAEFSLAPGEYTVEVEIGDKNTTSLGGFSVEKNKTEIFSHILP